MTNYMIKYATSKSMRINHNICNNARMRKRNRSRMRKKIGHAELLSNGATARYTQEPSQKKRPQIQTIKNIWRTNRKQPQTTNIPHLTSIQTKNTKKTKKKKTHIWEHTYTKLQTHVKDNVFGRMIAREFCKYILTNSKKGWSESLNIFNFALISVYIHLFVFFLKKKFMPVILLISRILRQCIDICWGCLVPSVSILQIYQTLNGNYFSNSGKTKIFFFMKLFICINLLYSCLSMNQKCPPLYKFYSRWGSERAIEKKMKIYFAFGRD